MDWLCVTINQRRNNEDCWFDPGDFLNTFQIKVYRAHNYTILQYSQTVDVSNTEVVIKSVEESLLFWLLL